MTNQEFDKNADVLLERQDYVNNTILETLRELAGKPIEYDPALIGSIRDRIEREFVARKIMTEDEFYPGYEEQIDTGKQPTELL